MATAEDNTFTVDTTVPTETVTDNLTPEEQDSLAVGEKLQAEVSCKIRRTARLNRR